MKREDLGCPPRSLRRVVIGGPADDTVPYPLDRHGVRVDLSDGSSSGRSTDRLRGIENLIGSRGPDVLIGDDRDNLLRGLGGLDRLVGRGGRDGFFARNGRADVIYGSAGRDVATVDAAKDDVYSAGGSSESPAEVGNGSRDPQRAQPRSAIDPQVSDVESEPHALG
jgi:hypothetical protein